MKFKTIAYTLAVGIAFIFSAFTSRSESSVVNRAFMLIPGTDPYDPLNYTEWYGTDPYGECVGYDEICIIDIPLTDIYTWADAPDPLYVGKPKVDIQRLFINELADDIFYALNHPYEDVFRNRRFIFLRESSN